VTDSSNRSAERGDDASPDPVLRGKYLDYCSARVAEVLLGLSSDEMYVLAEEVAGEADAGSGRTRSFGEIVRLATERIWRDLSLPTLEEWAKDYEEDPEAFERQMLGLWQEDADTANRTPF
jgi:hypothetical protein